MKNITFLIVIVSLSLIYSCFSEDTKDILEPQVAISQVEINDLKVLREEEKLARDVYIYAYNIYGNNIFTNISKSEQQHMGEILVLLKKYNIDDPALPENGKFTNQELQKLYIDLTEQVDMSLVEALKVGATIEDLDIRDIEDFEDRTNKVDILSTYAMLKCGSRNHMRNYYSQLENNGVTYTSQFISESELIKIITSSNEQCGK